MVDPQQHTPNHRHYLDTREVSYFKECQIRVRKGKESQI